MTNLNLKIGVDRISLSERCMSLSDKTEVSGLLKAICQIT